MNRFGYPENSCTDLDAPSQMFPQGNTSSEGMYRPYFETEIQQVSKSNMSLHSINKRQINTSKIIMKMKIQQDQESVTVKGEDIWRRGLTKEMN